jgi:3-deoxy-D-manno-octulosonic-acid transferase
VIWLHCVSVGETQAARPLAQAVLDRFPTHLLVVSTTTSTGQSLAREIFGTHAAAVVYFPFDWAWTVRRALKRIGPSLVLIMETELWPRFFRECRRREIPLIIVNGRLSDRSFSGYKLVRPFIGRVVNDISIALMQTARDADRLSALGLSRERVAVSGSIKFDAQPGSRELGLTRELGQQFDLDGGDTLIVAASTHAPEEEIFLKAIQLLKERVPELSLRLLIAPRRPERFSEVASLLDSSKFSWCRRSQPADSSGVGCEAILLDTVGELQAVYPLAAIVFVGGSIAPRGGHNVLEPAAAGACIVTGWHTENFESIVHKLVEADALVQLHDRPEAETPLILAEVFAGLLADRARACAIADNARRVFEENQGATRQTVEIIAGLIDPTGAGKESPRAKLRD